VSTIPTAAQQIDDLKSQLRERDAYLAAAHNTIEALMRILEHHGIDLVEEAQRMKSHHCICPVDPDDPDDPGDIISTCPVHGWR
jgi:hypothetical protein